MNYENHRLDYCQFLLSSQVNFTQTYLAEHSEDYSHDQMNRFLRQDKITPRLVWENVREDLVASERGHVLFDDVVLDKRHSRKSEVVRRQWSGNEKRVIRGIGVVTCVYVNPETAQFWVIDFRLYDPEGDGKSKLAHLLDMLSSAVFSKQLPFQTVLMDSWYATMKVIKRIEKLEKVYYCPLKSNRLVSDDEQAEHKRVDSLTWSEDEAHRGKLVHIRKFPKGHRVKLFRLAFSTERTEYIITNDVSQDSANAAQDECRIRWKKSPQQGVSCRYRTAVSMTRCYLLLKTPFEQFHRETKQVTGIEACQCRSPRAQRNHVACAFLVWTSLKRHAEQVGTSIYQLKRGLLDDYMKQQLDKPAIPMVLRA